MVEKAVPDGDAPASLAGHDSLDKLLEVSGGAQPFALCNDVK